MRIRVEAEITGGKAKDVCQVIRAALIEKEPSELMDSFLPGQDFKMIDDRNNKTVIITKLADGDVEGMDAILFAGWLAKNGWKVDKEVPLMFFKPAPGMWEEDERKAGSELFQEFKYSDR